MNQSKPTSTFIQQFERIKFITGTRTQAQLAEFLGIHQSAIAAAKRRGKIPSGWLVILTTIKGVHPEWILTGTGTCCMQTPMAEQYDADDATQEQKNDEEALQRLPTEKIADELLRRAWLLRKQVSVFIQKRYGASS